jgi:hypothetical protein
MQPAEGHPPVPASLGTPEQRPAEQATRSSPPPLLSPPPAGSGSPPRPRPRRHPPAELASLGAAATARARPHPPRQSPTSLSPGPRPSPSSRASSPSLFPPSSHSGSAPRFPADHLLAQVTATSAPALFVGDNRDPALARTAPRPQPRLTLGGCHLLRVFQMHPSSQHKQSQPLFRSLPGPGPPLCSPL